MSIRGLNPVTRDLEESLRQISPGGLRAYGGRYCDDPRGRSRIQDAVVLAPSSTSEVSAIVKLCCEASVAVIPFGGGTGLAGGQFPQGLPRPVVLSLERMNRIRGVCALENVMTVEAGCILENVHAAAGAAGRLFPLSLAAKGSCQIGGNLATNAGGVHVLRYGNARDLCLGLEVVLPDGRIWDGLTSLRKDNSGYDMRNLIIGSEGTLGVITAATLKLFRQPAEVATALLAVASPGAALDLLGFFQDRFGSMISAFELISRVGFDFQAEMDPDFDWPMESRPDWMVLVDISSETQVDTTGLLMEVAGEAFERSMVSDGSFPSSERQREELWNIREAIPIANRSIGAISSHDLSIPIGSVAEFVEIAESEVGRIGEFRINCFGHLGDGNLHFNVFPPTKPDGKSTGETAREEVRQAVRGVVRRFRGSLSAEHGTGRFFAEELLTECDSVFVAMMQTIKQGLDPAGIMNPGAVFPDRRSTSRD